MAMSLAFHILFAVAGMAMPLLMVLAEWLHQRTGEAAALEIADDGKGFPVGKAGRIDSYGIMGMRERASSIGATLEMHSEEGRGTVVRCFLAADRNAGARA